MALLLHFSPNALRAAPGELVAPGNRPVPLGVHALVGGRVVVKPGEVLDSATILIRDGYIEKVGRNLTPPSDARVWDMKGLTIYAGFIDPYLTLAVKSEEKGSKKEVQLTGGGGIRFFGVTPQDRDAGAEGPGYEVTRVTPERRAVQTYAPDAKLLESMRDLGFTVASVTPGKGILRGTSALVALSDEEANRVILKPDVFQHVAFDLEHRKADTYPESHMGVIAVVRQSFLDAEHYSLDQADFQKHPRGRARPAFNPALAALAPALEKKMTVVFEPRDALLVDRAARTAREMNLDFYVVASGQEWRRPELARAAGVPFIVPLNFPNLPKMPTDDDWEQVTLDELRAWDWAPENPAVLRQQGLEIALTTSGLAEKKDFRKNLRLAVDRGLSESNALAALTVTPARLCGVEEMLGTIESGKQANLTVVDGKGYFDTESKVQSVWIDGRFYRNAASAPKDEPAVAQADGDKPDAEKKEPAKADAKSRQAAEDKKKAEKEKKLARIKELQKRVARSPLDGRGAITNPPAVLIYNATLWTCGPEGTLEHADLLVQNGKIQKVGQHLFPTNNPPKKTLVIDGTGLHVTPGLIDCHSHSMILGDVNEGTLPSTAMVRIGDVINSESDEIYPQLAGGLTTANELHGSANPIGGQNCVIKLRDGETPEAMKFQDAMPGIKFALGENVKQSNWGDSVTNRFPQSRMGVQTFFNNRFVAARQYLKAWADYKKSGGVRPRRDLELEALGEIIEGRRLIHCHSYRQDEILMLLRTMESFGVKVGTLQHVLEGYKVADEIAKHGAGASTFADWWAYKYEVFDGIPYNGSLMRERGVVVSFNSDSGDLARRLNFEAAKAVKFGGTPEAEALKFVTLNPAKQLHIDRRVGSLEPGKDADFAIWSKAPLDSFTSCRQTWIDGKKYFDITLTTARSAALAKEREALLAKAKKLLAMSDDGGGSGGDADSDDTSFFQKSLEHLYDGRNRHCLDDHE